MKRFSILISIAAATVAQSAFAGGHSKEMKQVAPAPCEEFYSDNEWNVNLWGTYTFTNTDYNPNGWLVDIVQSTSEGGSVLGSFDKYIGGDHVRGGGGEIKYLFLRFFVF